MPATIEVLSYDEGNDAFNVLCNEAANPREHIIDGELLSIMTGHSDEPSEFIGKTFTIGGTTGKR